MQLITVATRYVRLIVNRHHLDLMPVVVLLLQMCAADYCCYPMCAVDCEQTSFRPHACCGGITDRSCDGQETGVVCAARDAEASSGVHAH